MTMTLEQVRDVLRNAGRYDLYGTDLQACDLADAIDARLTQPAQSVDVEKVREAFEACYLRDNEAGILFRDEDGEYVSLFTKTAWQSWLASKAQSSDVLAIREVIASIDLRAETYLDPQCKGWVDKLTAALQEKGNGAG